MTDTAPTDQPILIARPLSADYPDELLDAVRQIDQTITPERWTYEMVETTRADTAPTDQQIDQAIFECAALHANPQPSYHDALRAAFRAGVAWQKEQEQG